MLRLYSSYLLNKRSKHEWRGLVSNCDGGTYSSPLPFSFFVFFLISILIFCFLSSFHSHLHGLFSSSVHFHFHFLFSSSVKLFFSNSVGYLQFCIRIGNGNKVFNHFDSTFDIGKISALVNCSVIQSNCF